MAADEAQQEPTMEEILASIRKIISEDDEPANESAAAEPAVEDIDDDDVLELEPMEEEISFDEVDTNDDFEGDDIVAFEPEPEPEPEPIFEAPEPPKPQKPVEADDDKLLEDEVVGSAAGALGRLMGTMSMGSNNSLEDLVREMLRPMLKEWLNENLPGIVEAKVEEEVKRISRMAR